MGMNFKMRFVVLVVSPLWVPAFMPAIKGSEVIFLCEITLKKIIFSWHPEHFVCVGCNASLQSGFIDIGGLKNSRGVFIVTFAFLSFFRNNFLVICIDSERILFIRKTILCKLQLPISQFVIVQGNKRHFHFDSMKHMSVT
jgi:hypothetical protein